MKLPSHNIHLTCDLRYMINRNFLPFLLILLVLKPAHAATFSTDICVYGSTSGGVVAAVQAARMGKSVIVADPGQHVGGMTASGLGMVDFGNKAAIGGISHEFIDRVIQHYPDLPPAEWKQGKGWTFEPHVAEAIYHEMLDENKVSVQFNEELASVEKNGTTISQITMANGDIFHAKIFIDATYEGDLMARAHVSYTINRESNAQYSETLNGIRLEPANQLGPKLQIDPYVRPGDAASGLIPLIQSDPPGQDGEAGPAAVQAYNYRLCLTQKAANKMPIEPPPGYDPNRYELVARYIAALQGHGMDVDLSRSGPKGEHLLKISSIPNGKTDLNNNGWISTDYVGYSSDYPEADYATRKKIAKDHENYMRGLFQFLATDPRVPEKIRKEMQSWGLCRDEFQDNNGWPFQIYVREARRMIGSYVMTEHDCLHQTTFDDAIGLASYPMDSHYFRRVVHNGIVVVDGGSFGNLRKPYPISYRAILPKAEECQNLLVPACCSASHAAYDSMRMEPVFMILGQSAATAASIAIDDGVSLQNVDIQKLQARLRSDKQIF
jgi:hypothetical protein